MNRLVRVAVIDDGINEKLYNIPLDGHNIEIHSDMSISERYSCDDFSPSHGTTCAAIIHKYADEIAFSSVKILNDMTKRAVKDQLIRALYWCAENDMQIANLSLGTIDFRDFEEIRGCVDQVTKKGLFIVSACNNKNVFTYPACLPNVIGVSCRSSLLDEQYCIGGNVLSGIDIAASGSHHLTDSFGNSRLTNPSNSFAAPLITAKACQAIKRNCGITLEGMKKELYKGAANKDLYSGMCIAYNGPADAESQEYIKLLEYCIGEESRDIDIPVMKLIFDESCAKEDSLYLLDALNRMFRHDGYYSIAVCNLYKNKLNDLEYFPHCRVKEKRFLSHIYKKYNCDLILLGYSVRDGLNLSTDNSERYHEFDIQVLVSMDADRAGTIEAVDAKADIPRVYVNLCPGTLHECLKDLYNTIIELFS